LGVLEKVMNVRASLLILLLACVACAGAAPPRAVPGAGAPVAAVPSGPAASEADAAVPIHSHNPSWGSREAPVTIVEYSDFQCPFCQRVQPTLARIRATYGPQAVRLVWKNNPLPFHAEARPAAEAAMGVLALAGADAFWRFHDMLFQHQDALGPDSYAAWAKDAGVTDLAAWRAGIASHAWIGAVDADENEGQALGVDGTPSFFVNGVALVGAQPFEAFQALVDDQARAAHEKLASGTAPDRVYSELARENRARAPKPQAQEEEEPEDTQTVFRIPVGKSPVLGNPNALVTLVEFSDYQCPFCARVEPTLKALVGKYGDKLRIVWKNSPLPFHQWAEPAAEAALEVRAEKGNPAFWQMHDAIFASQSTLEPSVLVKLGAASGARAEKVKSAIEAHTYLRDIEADLDVAEDFEADGTPHFFLNGRRLVGAQPREKFEAIIDEEIKKAQDLLAKGTRPADLYDALVKEGKGPPPPETKEIAASVPANDPVRGSKTAKVTLHEWSDFQCPFCERVEPTIERVMKEYGDRVRFVWHDFPLPMHPDAPLAAQAAREAYKQKGQKGFWDLHDRLFKNQENLGRGDLDGYARELSLDMDKWKAALDGGTHASEIEADRKAAEDMSIRGTPGFVVVPGHGTRGYFLSGAQSYAKFRKLIERALAESK
jgi:protein-disulfide isomerase